MKLFWSLIALLTVATVVVFVVEPSGNSHQATANSNPDRKGGDSSTSGNPDRQGGDTRLANGDRDRQGAGSASEQHTDWNPDRQGGGATPQSPLTRRVKRDHEHQQPIDAPPEAPPSTESADNPLAFLNSLTGGGRAGAKDVDEDTKARDRASKNAKITRLPNGIEVDGRFTIRGKGSPRDPYEIPWELLISAKEVYVPKDGREIIPGRVEMLHESWVSITGYVMLPTVRDSVDEFVIMQNQWDGCCLGIPPTAYDSVEVSLNEPVDFGFGSRQYATVTGRMTVDPYLFGSGMLLGLYEIRDAEITVTEW